MNDLTLDSRQLRAEVDTQMTDALQTLHSMRLVFMCVVALVAYLFIVNPLTSGSMLLFRTVLICISILGLLTVQMMKREQAELRQ